MKDNLTPYERFVSMSNDERIKYIQPEEDKGYCLSIGTRNIKLTEPFDLVARDNSYQMNLNTHYNTYLAGTGNYGYDRNQRPRIPVKAVTEVFTVFVLHDYSSDRNPRELFMRVVMDDAGNLYRTLVQKPSVRVRKIESFING